MMKTIRLTYNHPYRLPKAVLFLGMSFACGHLLHRGYNLIESVGEFP